MSRANPPKGQLSTYTFPKELRVDELLLRAPGETDIGTIAPAFRDPDVGGEAGLPPWDAATLRRVMVEQLPHMIESGLLFPYVIVDTRNADAYAQSHIPGAILLPLEGQLTWPESYQKTVVEPLKRATKPLVTYCA